MTAGEACWEQVLRKLRISYKKRSTGVLVALCPFHEERTASCNFWPSGNFRCHGCGLTGDMTVFINRYKPVDAQDFFNKLPLPPDPGQSEFWPKT